MAAGEWAGDLAADESSTATDGLPEEFSKLTETSLSKPSTARDRALGLPTVRLTIGTMALRPDAPLGAASGRRHIRGMSAR